jgi:hypothetical protein
MSEHDFSIVAGENKATTPGTRFYKDPDQGTDKFENGQD